MKACTAIFVVIMITVRVGAQIPVTDAANLANNRAAQSENIAKWIESIQHLREQIDALNRQINIQSDIRRWAGNPAEASAKMALEGLGGPELARQYGQGKRAIIDLVDSLQSLKRTGEGNYREIKSIDLDGNEFHRDPMIYRRYAVLDAKQDNTQQVIDETREREQQLQAEVAATLEDLKGAQTDAEVQKLSAKLNALNGQLAQVDAARRREVDQVVLQKIANDARSELEQRSNAELAAKNDYLVQQPISAYMNTLRVRRNNEPPR